MNQVYERAEELVRMTLGDFSDVEKGQDGAGVGIPVSLERGDYTVIVTGRKPEHDIAWKASGLG